MRRQQERKRKNNYDRKTVANWHVPLPSAVSELLWKHFPDPLHEPAGWVFPALEFIPLISSARFIFAAMP
jgi:hypothetical protein